MQPRNHALLSLALAALGGSAATAAVPAAARRAPLISTTARDPDCQAAEIRLARFVRALQMDRRGDAVQFFSLNVTPAERQSFMQGKWPGRSLDKTHDLSVVLFQPDLQIRTRNRYPDALRMDVMPRAKPKKGKAPRFGYLPVKMRRENGQWFVDLHPMRADIPFHVTRMAKERRDHEKNAPKPAVKPPGKAGVKPEPTPKTETPAR